MTQPIEVHVFGGRKGESVALRLPGDLWGVVDNYTPKLDDPQTNPTLRFLQHRNVNRLGFICLTHPHSDHYRGMADLLERFRPGRIWLFGAMTHRDLYAKVAEVIRHKADSSWVPSDDEEVADELVRILDVIRDRLRAANGAGRPDVRRLELGLPLLQLSGDPPVTITAIGASGGQCLLYERSLRSCFDGKDNFLAAQVPKVNHNRISGGLLIEYGEARIVLGADIEKEGWQETLSILGGGGRLGSVLVKVSHHGSTNGYCEGLWEQLSPNKAAVAVLAPYVSHDLPSPAGLSHVSKHAKQTFVASLSAAALATDWLRNASESDWPGVSFETLVALRSLFPRSCRPTDRLEGRCSFFIHHDGTLRHEEEGEAGQLLPSSLAPS